MEGEDDSSYEVVHHPRDEDEVHEDMMGSCVVLHKQAKRTVSSGGPSLAPISEVKKSTEEAIPSSSSVSVPLSQAEESGSNESAASSSGGEGSPAWWWQRTLSLIRQGLTVLYKYTTAHKVLVVACVPVVTVSMAFWWGNCYSRRRRAVLGPKRRSLSSLRRHDVF